MTGFTREERTLVVGMSLLTGIRMLGVSLIVPIFSLFAVNLGGATNLLAGLAMGAFGLSQTLFQIPMGRLSDRSGRKKATIIGLSVYFAGTVLCGFSTTIAHLIAARFFAGASAISGVTLAWLTEGVHVHRRNRAVAYLGMTIGMAVIAGFPLSALIAGWLGAPAVFFICAFFTALSIAYTVFYLKDSEFVDAVSPETGSIISRSEFMRLFAHADLLRLNSLGFITNLTFMGMFFILPILMSRQVSVSGMWKYLAPPAILGTAMMFYFARQADRHGTVRITLIGLCLELAGALTPFINSEMPGLFLSLVLFYCGHCVLSPVLPVAVSRYPRQDVKGAIMGSFASAQFLGSGIGGIVIGFLSEFSFRTVLGTVGAMTLIAMVIIVSFSNFRREN